MTALRHRQTPRQRQPELEHDYARPTSLGYEAAEDTGVVRCLAHGFPTPLARWHFHDEYELHLIVQTRGKVFVGSFFSRPQPHHSWARPLWLLTWRSAGPTCVVIEYESPVRRPGQ